MAKDVERMQVVQIAPAYVQVHSSQGLLWLEADALCVMEETKP